MNLKNVCSLVSYSASVLILNLISIVPVFAQTPSDSKIFPAKEFLGNDWSVFPDSKTWGGTFPGGKTERGVVPVIIDTGSDVYARFPLHRFNPNFPNVKLQGSEIRTNYRWSLQDNKAIEFDFVVRIPAATPGGVVMGVFVYNDKGFIDNKSFGVSNDEIDFEMPRHLLPNAVWLNLFRDHESLSDGIENGLNEDSETLAGMKLASPLPLNEWFTVKIRWTKNRVAWYVGDGKGRDFRIVRDIKRDSNVSPLPDAADPVGVQLNIWTPPNGWFVGSPSLSPVPKSEKDVADPPFPNHETSGRGAAYFDVRQVRVFARAVRGVPKGQKAPKP